MSPFRLQLSNSVREVTWIVSVWLFLARKLKKKSSMDLPTHQNQNENQSKSILNRSLQFKLFDFFFSLSSKNFLCTNKRYDDFGFGHEASSEMWFKTYQVKSNRNRVRSYLVATEKNFQFLLNFGRTFRVFCHVCSVHL